MGVEDEQESKRTRIINDLSSRRTLPPEIIAEILLSSPVETLLRCKSVCKSWYELISSRHFIYSHVKLWNEKNRYVSPKLMLHKPTYCFRHDYYTRTMIVDNALHMISSCNGLLCYVKDYNTPFIYNPSTRVCNMLPSSGYAGGAAGHVLSGYTLGAGYAFGYDESTYDYKVIVLSSRGNTGKIYSLRTGVWKNINDVPYIPKMCKHATFSKGAFHWMVRQRVDSPSFHLTTIVSLDLATETFGEVPPPVLNNNERNWWITFGALGDWLCVFVHYKNENPRADLWVMKVYGVRDSWTKLVSIPYGTTGTYEVPLSISNDGKFLLKSSRGKLLVYDSINCTFDEIHDFGAKFEACSHVESLVSPHSWPAP